MTTTTSDAAATAPTEGNAMNERLVDAGALTLNVALREGSPGRTPLLLINGIGAQLEALQPFVDALDPEIPVIRFDVPGVGHSPAADRPYSMWGLAAALATVLDELGIDRVDVLGLSWGGALAQQFAVSQNRRLRRLVLVATGAAWAMVPASPTVLRHLSTPRRHADPLYMERIAAEIYGGSVRADPTILRRLGIRGPQRARGGREKSYSYQLLALLTAPGAPLLRLVRQPALVLGGDDDPIVPLVNTRIVSSFLPHARRHVYPGGHVEMVTRPSVVVPVVEQFLSE